MTDHPQEHESLDAFVAKVEASGEDKKHEVLGYIDNDDLDEMKDPPWHVLNPLVWDSPLDGTTAIYTQAQRDAYAAEAVKQERKTQADDYWTLICAVENMRSASHDERTINARWELARELAMMAERIVP